MRDLAEKLRRLSHVNDVTEAAADALDELLGMAAHAAQALSAEKLRQTLARHFLHRRGYLLWNDDVTEDAPSFARDALVEADAVLSVINAALAAVGEDCENCAGLGDVPTADFGEGVCPACAGTRAAPRPSRHPPAPSAEAGRVRELEEVARDFLSATEALGDWINGNDLVADWAEAAPEDYRRLNDAMRRIRAALSESAK